SHGLQLTQDQLIGIGSAAAMQGLTGDQLDLLVGSFSGGQSWDPDYLQLLLYQKGEQNATGDEAHPMGVNGPVTYMDHAISTVVHQLGNMGITVGKGGLSFGAVRNLAQWGLEHGGITADAAASVNGSSLGDYLKGVVQDDKGTRYSSWYTN